MGAVDALLNRYLVEGVDGIRRPLRYAIIRTFKRVEETPDIRDTDIAVALGIPATTMQSALDRLVRMGFIGGVFLLSVL